MALRIHFTAEDLARTTVAARPDIMWELTISLHRLQAPRRTARCRPWLGHVRDRLGRRDLRSVLHTLTTLVPARGDFPDFLTPPGQLDFADALDVIAGGGGRMFADDLASVFRVRERPLWIRQLADGDRERSRELLDALAVYHRELLRPCLPELDETVLAERAVCGRRVLDGGIGKLLGVLSPSVRWAWPVLTTDYPVDRDLHLAGRGITLVPSFFCATPVTLIDPELPPVLVYPVTGAGPRAAAGTDGTDGLTPVLGRTRALAIRALVHPYSTSELALRIGVSVASASRHAAALRDAGLVSSTREGGVVLHAATRLGRELAGGGRELARTS
ncbi:winged helix-turn-helix domain-containing protein [Streptomyces sp. NBC_01381]|uniref:ArsR/SmtB family transcription factor n=1 Tax=Streptomyces sp. NBC_01381 TaxID=2903845 RepID=UPI00225BAADD|nr:winged helix-turn-helix domain-containing protein [Streptomyces sp. NBC_01381]MCX4665687.1 winged helix-turn-helix domain-containing protein [Streptomyces sp. NBC_01381]